MPEIQYKNALNRFRVNLSRTINNKINKQADEFSERLMEVARQKAIEYIDLDTQMKPTSGSISAVEDLKNRIIVKKTKKSSNGSNVYKLTVANLQSKDDFALFLEYGTGYRGRLHSGETGRQDWEYVTNPDHDPAFYFRYDDTKFLSDSDNYPIKRPDKIVKKSESDTHTVTRRLKSGKIISYTRKSSKRKTHNDYGEIVDNGTYVRYPQKPNYKWVRSIGIRPVRYMYKTSKYIKGIIDQSKKLSMNKILDIIES